MLVLLKNLLLMIVVIKGIIIKNEYTNKFIKNIFTILFLSKTASSCKLNRQVKTIGKYIYLNKYIPSFNRKDLFNNSGLVKK